LQRKAAGLGEKSIFERLAQKMQQRYLRKRNIFQEQEIQVYLVLIWGPKSGPSDPLAGVGPESVS
jgi:hypothetical protein